MFFANFLKEDAPGCTSNCLFGSIKFDLIFVIRKSLGYEGYSQTIAERFAPYFVLIRFCAPFMIEMGRNDVIHAASIFELHKIMQQKDRIGSARKTNHEG